MIQFIMNYSHYFDWAATSPQDEDILKEALKVSVENFANPSSTHKAGTAARKVLEDARKKCASVLGVKSESVFFTSGGTESDAIPLLSVLAAERRGGRIIMSGIEHPAVKNQCEMLEKSGFEIVCVNPDKNGFVAPSAIAQKITSDTIFVAVMAVNNETGCIQPVREIAQMIASSCAGKRKPFFHVDCVQAAGKIPLDFLGAEIDGAAFSAHKISGPRGVGLLYLREPARFRPFLVGGGQEQGIRSGTENLFGAVALSKCMEKYVFMEENERFLLQKNWTGNFIKSLSEIKNCRLVPPIRADLSPDAQEKFSPWVVQAAFLGIPGQVMVRALDAKGFCISTGSACSAKKQSRPILRAMGTSPEIQDSAVRFSFGFSTSEQGMNELLDAVRDIVKEFA